MKLDRRLSKIESCISPRQAVVALIKKMHEYPNSIEYLAYLCSLPKTAWPIPNLMSQVTENAMNKTKALGLEGIAASKRVTLAENDALFLIRLHEHVNERFLLRCEIWSLKATVLNEKLEVIVHLEASPHRSKRRKIPQDLPNQTTEYLQKKREELKMLSRELLADLIAFEQAAAQISQDFFCGEEILFRDHAGCVAMLINDVETLINRFNDYVAVCADGTIDTIDVKEIRNEAVLAAPARKKQIVDVAKIEVLTLIDERWIASRLGAKVAFAPYSTVV